MLREVITRAFRSGLPVPRVFANIATGYSFRASDRKNYRRRNDLVWPDFFSDVVTLSIYLMLSHKIVCKG